MNSRPAPAGVLAPLVMVMLMLAALPVPVAAADDPLESFMWERYRARFLGDTPVRFDDRERVITPDFAEDSGRVPNGMQRGSNSCDKATYVSPLRGIAP